MTSSSTIEGFNIYMRTELCLSKNTISAYSRDVQDFISFIGEKPITANLIERFIGVLERGNLKATTIRRKYMSIRCLCHHLTSINQIDVKILGMIDSVRVLRGEPSVLANKDIDKILGVIKVRTPKSRATNIHRDIAIVLILYHSGLRVSELCNIDLPDVNLMTRMIKVKGKGRIERMVPTTEECIIAIKNYIQNERKSISNALFVKANGHRVTRRSIGYMITSVSHLAETQHTTPHMLRRSCATSLLERGVDLEFIKSLLGHKNLDTTQQYLAINTKGLIESHSKYHPFGDRHDV